MCTRLFSNDLRQALKVSASRLKESHAAQKTTANHPSIHFSARSRLTGELHLPIFGPGSTTKEAMEGQDEAVTFLFAYKASLVSLHLILLPLENVFNKNKIFNLEHF